MAEYFEKPEEAEAYLRRTHNPVALYARIQLHGSEKWMVDHYYLGHNLADTTRRNGRGDAGRTS